MKYDYKVLKLYNSNGHINSWIAMILNEFYRHFYLGSFNSGSSLCRDEFYFFCDEDKNIFVMKASKGMWSNYWFPKPNLTDIDNKLKSYILNCNDWKIGYCPLLDLSKDEIDQIYHDLKHKGAKHFLKHWS